MVKTDNTHAYARVAGKLRAAKCSLPYLVTLVWGTRVKHEPCTDLASAARLTPGAEYWLVMDVKADKYVDEAIVRGLAG